MSKQAWVTLATNDSYALGALVLAHSLRRVSSAYPAVVIITPSVTDNMRGRLGAVFGEVVAVDVLDSRDAAHLALLARPELGITFTKIHCWSLTQYDKCVFLDADTLVVQNCDELFEREELSAAPDVGWPDCFNSGVFVYRPSADTFSALLQFASERGSFDGGDQGLLNSYFSDWAHADISKHLPFLYNVTSAAFYSYLPALKHYGQDLKIIHFIGAAKPWLQRYNWESGAVDATAGHLQLTLQLWWDIFVQSVHPQLDETMVQREMFEAALEPPSARAHYTAPADPESEFPWHRAPSEAPAAETAPERHRQEYIEQCLAEFHDPWEHYRGNQPPDEHNTQVQARVEVHHEVTVDWASYKSAPHSTPDEHHRHDLQPAPVHRHEETTENGHSTDRNHSHSPVNWNQSHHTHWQVPLDTASHQQFHETQPAMEPNHELAAPEEHNEHGPVCNGDASSAYDSAGSETEGCREEVRARHPYDNYYLLHRCVVSERGHKRCSHEPPSPPPTPPPPSLPPPPSPPPAPLEEPPQVDQNQAGLAGTMARLTLGAAAAQQAALDEHTRRQGWEAGNIDYLGADSFANIWAKISATLAQGPPPAPAPAPEPPVSECECPEPAPVPVPDPVETSAPAPVEPPSPAPVETLEPAPVEPPTPALAAVESSTPVPAPVDPLTPAAAPVESPPSAPEPMESATSAPAPVDSPTPASVPVESPTSAPATVDSPMPAPAPVEPAAEPASPVIASEQPEPVEAPTPPPEVKPEPVPVALAEAPQEARAAAETPEVPTVTPATPVSEAPQEAVKVAESETAAPQEAVKVEESATAAPEEAVKVAESATTEPEEAVKVAESATAESPACPAPALQPETPEAASPQAAPPTPPATLPAQPPATPPVSAPLLSSSDSPPLVSTPVKDAVSPKSAEESKGDAASEGENKADERAAPPKDKLYCQLKPSAEPAPLLTPDSELEDAATLAQSIIASELTPATPGVISATPPALAPVTRTPLALNQKRLSVDEPVPETPPVSLAQIGILPTKPEALAGNTQTAQEAEAVKSDSKAKTSAEQKIVAPTVSSDCKLDKEESILSVETTPDSNKSALPEISKVAKKAKEADPAEKAVESAKVVPSKTPKSSKLVEPAQAAEPADETKTIKAVESKKTTGPAAAAESAKTPKAAEPTKTVATAKGTSKVAPTPDQKEGTKPSVGKETAPLPPVPAKLESLAKPSKSEKKEETSAEPKAEDTPVEPPKKKVIKKVVKKESSEGSKSEVSGSGEAASAPAPVPPPRKKVQKPKEK